MRMTSYNVPLGKTSYFPTWGLYFYIYIYIYILIDVEQIIFVQFIEFDSCNSTLKLVLCRKLKSFFDSYIFHDFLDPFVSIQNM